MGSDDKSSSLNRLNRAALLSVEDDWQLEINEKKRFLFLFRAPFVINIFHRTMDRVQYRSVREAKNAKEKNMFNDYLLLNYLKLT